MHVCAEGAREARKFGEGIIVQTKQVAGLDRHLVEFPDHQAHRWLPWHVLKMVPSVKQVFVTGRLNANSSAERARLKVLAHLFNYWQRNTGALSNLDIDPLPHQIHLVHHILNSGNYNWLIADDVGLGKTIEAGMLIYALRQRKEARRVLIITPSGLTTQWQEELASRFDLRDFQIYGRDFQVQKASHWREHSHNYVIGSMDQLKQEPHLEMLLNAEPWDLVLVDEAHRLSRRQYGLKLDASERFDLVKTLRKHERIESLVLLTATPHQGMQDKFTALLELLRPELRNELLMLDQNHELLGEMVIRNYKSDVTDTDGNFIFHGKTTRAVEVPVSDESREFDKSLQAYLRKGYSAGLGKGQTGRAIGFVMNVYRKLAASSVAAIHQSLCNRLQRLRQEIMTKVANAETFEDSRFEGEAQERQAELFGESLDEFFEGEMDLLEELIARAAQLSEHDLKARHFLDAIVSSILASNADEKVLIFTEYRSTQRYLQRILEERFGANTVALIHGSMSLDERTTAIEVFETQGQFLVSTEAGGEGINLQRHCHIMVNYDLPWNPMRLVQRIGRLYRYGQQKRVVVLNINARETLDENIITLMYERLNQVVSDMAAVQGDEFNEELKDDILGEVADLASLDDILANAQLQSIQRTQERIDEALERARNSAMLQRDLFEHAAGFDPAAFNEQLVVTEEHLKAFVFGMAQLLDIEVDTTYLRGAAWRLRFPDELRKQFGLSRTIHAVTFDRDLARRRDDLELMSFNSYLFEQLVKQATSLEFGGKVAATQIAAAGENAAIFAAILRWQNESGRRMREEFSLYLEHGGNIQHNPAALNHWLLNPALDSKTEPPSRSVNEALYERLMMHCAVRLQQQSHANLIPERIDLVSALWTCSK